MKKIFKFEHFKKKWIYKITSSFLNLKEKILVIPTINIRMNYCEHLKNKWLTGN